MKDYLLTIGGTALTGLIVALIAYFKGLSTGKSSAEKQADADRTKEILETVEHASKARQETAKEASNVQQTVNRMPDNAVRDKLRDKWRVPEDNGN